jgi:type I restriction enzyme S subunit
VAAMSKLDDLIREYCPDGVEYKKLDEIATITRGGNFQKKDFLDEGIPCIHYGQIYTKYNLFVDQTLSYISKEKSQKQKFAEPGDVIMAVTSENIEDVCKCVAWLGSEKLAVSGHTAIIHHNLNPKYLVYYLSSEAFYKQKLKLVHGTKVIEVTPKSLENVLIPVPPLPVQREIVRILDNFTELTAELTTELTAELSDRKKQYEYYCHKLFNKVTNTEKVTLNKIAFNCDNMRKPVTSDKRKKGTIPYYGASGIVDYVKDYIFDGDYLLISEDGANLLARSKPIAFSISGKTWVNNHAHVFKFKEYATRRYVEMFLNSIDLSPYITGAAQPKLSKQKLNKIPISLPPLEEQKRMVKMLDYFESICNDLSSGLLAEIEARQKQYAYYRDKLLDFKPLES